MVTINKRWWRWSMKRMETLGWYRLTFHKTPPVDGAEVCTSHRTPVSLSGCKIDKTHLTQCSFWFKGFLVLNFIENPPDSNYENFNGVINNYTDAANSTNSILCPVGKIWKEYCDKTNDYSYYGPDQFHPSLKGSEITAEVIVKSLLNL